MGKAALELPDTLEPSDGADKVNVDDLLAQMAGHEIDRLLAEADDPHRAPSEPHRATDVAAPPVATAPVLEPSPAPQVAASNPPTEAQTPEAPADDRLSKQLDELFSPPVTESPAKPRVTDPISATPVEPSAPTNIPAAPGVAEESATTTDERSALDDPLIGIDELAGDKDEAIEESVLDAPLPIYLKPLAWVNAPLNSLSDPMRQLIGKLALLTLFNATAVLIYVLVFRRHH